MLLSNKIINDIYLTNEIIDLVRNANKAIMEVYDDTAKKIITKENNTPLTEADLASNKILTEGLEKIFPNIPIVSEENESSLSIPQKCNVFWLIDPLDGTKEFINRNDEFTSNVALIENKKTRLGFVGVPCKELIYYGGKIFGSKSINKFNKISNIKYKSKTGVCRVIASKSHLNENTQDFIKNINIPIELIQAGSSLKFINIAEGLADIYPRLAPTSEWDTAAAQAILEGAGGTVKQLNGDDMIYGKLNILNPFFIAKGIFEK